MTLSNQSEISLLLSITLFPVNELHVHQITAFLIYFYYVISSHYMISRPLQDTCAPCKYSSKDDFNNDRIQWPSKYMSHSVDTPTDHPSHCIMIPKKQSGHVNEEWVYSWDTQQPLLLGLFWVLSLSCQD